ncbi:MAG: hypothetical protein AB3X44_10975 [Leptothrix sp. (in: b-proteobacteria)]
MFNLDDIDLDSLLLFAGLVVLFFAFEIGTPYLKHCMEERARRKKQEESIAISESKNEVGLDTIVVGLLLTYGAYKGFKKCLSVLADIDEKRLTTQDQEALKRFSLDLTRLGANEERLDRADALLLTGDRISIEEAALLTSAVLEAGLKEIRARYSINLPVEAEGMIGLAIVLRDQYVISNDACREIRHYGTSIRNKVMHGDFNELDRTVVEQQIQFTRIFLREHEIA